MYKPFVPLTSEQVAAMPTPRLLAYYKKHRTFPAELEDTDKAWDAYMALIKATLNTRGHVGPDRVTHKTRDPKRRQ